MSNTVRHMTKEAKEAFSESGDPASNASGDIQTDLAALRNDVTRLTSQITDILSARGSAVWRKAKADVEGAVSDAQDRGMEAGGAVREAGDNLVDAIDESLKRRPYATLALAVGMGFMFGATWRR